MRFNHVLNNFISGEWSPQMRARTDTEQYARAASEITNGFVRPQGGVFRRPGFVQRSKYSFDLSEDMVFIPYYFRDFRYLIIFADSGVYCVNADTWAEVPVDKYFQVVFPSDPQSIRYVQIGEILVLVRSDGKPLYAEYNFSTNGIYFNHYDDFYSSLNGRGGDTWRSIPFGPINSVGSRGTLTLTGTLTSGGTVTISTSLDTFSPAMVQSGAGSVNMLIRVTSGGNTAIVKVTGYTDSKTVTGEMVTTKTGTSPLTVGVDAGTAYELAEWNGADGWPTTITAIQNRLVFGKGSKLYFSRSGNFFDMMELPFVQAPDDAFEKALSDGSRPFSAQPFAGGLVEIRELTSHKTLVILTDDQEIVGYGGASGISANPGGLIVESSSSFGASKVPPVRINNYVTFVQKTGTTVRDLNFSWEQNQYNSTDLTFPAEHMFRDTTIKRIATSEEKGSHLWVLTNSGKMYQCSLDRDYQINAWTRVSIKDREIVSVGVVKASGTQNRDLLVVGVKDKDDSLSLCLMSTEYTASEIYPLANYYPEYMDMFRYISGPGPVITGLTDLVNEEVQVVLDGFYKGKYTVDSNGDVDVGQEFLMALVGLPSTFRVVTNPVEAGAQMGDSTGKKKRITDVFIRLWNTLGCRYGSPETREYYDIPFREDSQPMDEPSRMRDMDINMSFPSGYHEVARVEIESDYPFPCNVLAVGIQGVTNE